MVRESVQNSPVGKEKVYRWRKGFAEKPSQVLSSDWKTERVREDESGDRRESKKSVYL